MSAQISVSQKKITALDIQNGKGGKKIVAVTAYDATFARLFDPHVDIILVGDSLGMVIQGNQNTLSVTLGDMIYHSKAVARGRKLAHLVVDMPFLSFQIDPKTALKNAGRLIAEGNAEAVKLEGGVSVAKAIEKITNSGIPVMAHLGLIPQSVHKMGGYKIQGKTDLSRRALLEDAIAVQDAGAYAVVLEGIPADLAAEISKKLLIPTIGIGAGSQCDGQVLVAYDLLGLIPDFSPKFVKRFVELHKDIGSAVSDYAQEVREGTFPGKEHSF